MNGLFCHFFLFTKKHLKYANRIKRKNAFDFQLGKKGISLIFAELFTKSNIESN
jgi:general stress protein 26